MPRILFHLSAMCLVCFVFTAARAQEETDRGRPIEGRVVTEGGQPLAGATVLLRSFGAGQSQRTTGTNEDGRFSFPDLDPGAYSVGASMPGYYQVPDAQFPDRSRNVYRRGDNATLTLAKGGVITGKVTDRAGDAVVGVSVRAIKLSDAEGRPVAARAGIRPDRERPTDDRGIYRIFALEPGTYIVAAGRGSPYTFPRVNAFDADAPTFHPSSTSDTAARVTVLGNQEASGIDIIHRGEAGHTVSGKTTPPLADTSNAAGGISLRLTAASGAIEHTTYIQPRSQDSTFGIDGVADGEYVLIARHTTNRGETLAAAPRRITVKGANVIGIELALLPLAAFDARVRVEPLADAARSTEACAAQRGAVASLPETVVRVRRNTNGDRNKPPVAATTPDEPLALNFVPDGTGKFRVHSLEAGEYYIEVDPPSAAFYVRDITFNSTPNPTPARGKSPSVTKSVAKPAAQSSTLPAVARSEFIINESARPSGVTVTLAAGAARITGTIKPENADGGIKSGTRVLLVPVETEHAEHAWRYHSAAVGSDGKWTLRYVAPGAYRIFTMPAEAAARDTVPPAFASDATRRAILRREAQARGTQLELKACEHLAYYALRPEPSAAEVK